MPEPRLVKCSGCGARMLVQSLLPFGWELLSGWFVCCHRCAVLARMLA